MENKCSNGLNTRNNLLMQHISFQQQYFQNLHLHSMTLQDYIQKMINRVTNGLDITLIVLSMMLDVWIVCLYQKYMWISKEIDLTHCDIYLTLNKGGHFKVAILKNGYKILVKIPEECRPLYITSDSTKDDTKLEELHGTLNDLGLGKLIIK